MNGSMKALNIERQSRAISRDRGGGAVSKASTGATSRLMQAEYATAKSQKSSSRLNFNNNNFGHQQPLRRAPEHRGSALMQKSGMECSSRALAATGPPLYSQPVTNNNIGQSCMASPNRYSGLMVASNNNGSTMRNSIGSAAELPFELREGNVRPHRKRSTEKDGVSAEKHGSARHCNSVMISEHNIGFTAQSRLLRIKRPVSKTRAEFS